MSGTLQCAVSQRVARDTKSSLPSDELRVDSALPWLPHLSDTFSKWFQNRELREGCRGLERIGHGRGIQDVL